MIYMYTSAPATLSPKTISVLSAHTAWPACVMCDDDPRQVAGVEATLAELDPGLVAQLQERGSGLSSLTLPWVICLFAAALPLPVVLAAWDLLLLGMLRGPTAPSPRAALAELTLQLLRHAAPELRQVRPSVRPAGRQAGRHGCDCNFGRRLMCGATVAEGWC